MSDFRIFDQLPVELLHTLFNYFSASELLFTFYNVNVYVNATLQTYCGYQFDFKSISKSHFRRICRHVRPEQVVSLTLSDGDDTPGQSEIFFSCFRIEQFIRLRSLTLIEIEFNSLGFIFASLPQLHELRSFTFNAYSIRHTYGPLELNSPDKLNQINFMLRATYAQVFPRLYFLSLNGDWVLDSIPLPNLLHLKLEHCPFNKLGTIVDSAPELRSLDACVNYDQLNFEPHILPPRLTRLRLEIQDVSIPMIFMEYLLSGCSHLKHLELHLIGLGDLARGELWEPLTKSLITFNFKFHIPFDLIEQTLNSFRTSFWVEEKRWFVAYQDKCLFSVPYFAPERIWTSYKPPIHSTAPDNEIFYKNVAKLIVNESHIHLVHHSILRAKMLGTVDLCNVTSLSVVSLDDLLQFTPAEWKISQLSIKKRITIDQLERMMNNSYEQIRILEIEDCVQGRDHIIEELFRLFPNTERFIYKPNIQSIALMTRFIDGFTHLSSASFISLGPLYNQDVKFCFDPDLLLLKANRPTYGISMCRIYHLCSSTSLFGIHWWIEE